MDTVLFSILILQGLCDSQGCSMWRPTENAVHLIEITMNGNSSVRLAATKEHNVMLF